MITSAEAEETAKLARAELGLTVFARLEPPRLLQQLGIAVVALSSLASTSGDPDLAGAVQHLLVEDTSALSAATVFLGRERLIVHNDGHPPERVVSNLAHEAAHALLLHDPRPSLDASGCRDWHDGVEKEATYLAGCLLVPGPAARAAFRRGWSDTDVAEHYGVSESMARYRLNMTGARRQRRTGASPR